MNSTRDRILTTLLQQPRASINVLAHAVGINAISVRHHLINLQAEGLITAEEERHGVGRPRLVYTLTEKGLERFPSRYLSLTNRLLDQLKESLPKKTIDRLFVQMAKEMAAEYAPLVASLPMEEKLNMVKALLAKEGFSVEWEKDGERYLIHEISCPYYHIGQSHPEVCEVDQTVIATILANPVEKVGCIFSGQKHCSYAINVTPASDKPK
ncbi:MAG: winged helix-turn-helix transcriptional regulator [Anaerolineaceae bacterium]|nr:winged helix-turn-helix transcriptional regulator [Anaerolineaceae bacterium]